MFVCVIFSTFSSLTFLPKFIITIYLDAAQCFKTICKEFKVLSPQRSIHFVMYLDTIMNTATLQPFLFNLGMRLKLIGTKGGRKVDGKRVPN